jgi:hypothetical protein
MRKDRFTDEALRNARALAELKYSENPEEQTAFAEAYDFARCQRPDGTFYGTSGQCRKGQEAGANKKLKTDFRKEVAAGAAKRKVRDEKITARQGRDAELRTQIRDAIVAQRPIKAELDRRERALREVERRVKKDPSKENRANMRTLAAAVREKEREYNKAEREIEKMARERARLERQRQRELMTPAQRAEERRVGKIIKERG